MLDLETEVEDIVANGEAVTRDRALWACAWYHDDIINEGLLPFLIERWKGSIDIPHGKRQVSLHGGCFTSVLDSL